MIPEPTIVCVDCGGRAHLLTTWPDDDPPQPGDVVSYRCSDCLDRWDLVLPDEDPDDHPYGDPYGDPYNHPHDHPPRHP